MEDRGGGGGEREKGEERVGSKEAENEAERERPTDDGS